LIAVVEAKTIQSIVLVGFLLFLIVPLPISVAQNDWWDPAWSFRQELLLGSLTSEEFAAYQPVDIALRFDFSCWAVSEIKHSVRVICQTKNDFLELESQLYDLEFTDENHITSCNLVFLVPPEADGNERYFVYSDGSPTPASEYPDHVSITDSSYYYEPIPGYPLESHFYQISQDGTVRYAIAQEGKFLWHTTAQSVTKMKQGSTEVAPKNGQAIANFEFVYYYAEEMWQYSSTSQKLISKEILCDGTLMVSCKIVSRSTDGSLQTTAVYKYFYCPIPLERIQVHVVHEALKECHVYEQANTDGVYASLQCGRIKSASISDLNFGMIYPYFHFYSNQDTVEEYPVDLHPESTQKDPVIWLLETADDVHLGNNAWVSFDEGASGEVHALLFGSTSVVTSGEDERDGIQLKAYESNYPRFPGLDYVIAAVQCTRNTYEKNIARKDTVIPKGFVAEFDVEFFSSPTGGYVLVEKEASIFQALVPLKPSTRLDDFSVDPTTTERFSLTVFVHNARSFPFGSVFSAVTGRHFPYLTVEIHRDTGMVRAGTAGRLPIQESASTHQGSSLKDTLVSAIRMIDFRNLSFFKICFFERLEQDRYVIKVFKENPRVWDQRLFIGCMVVDLTKDSSVHVLCQPQGSCVVSLVDQHGRGVRDAHVMLVKQGMVIAQNRTTADGFARLTAPCDRKESYQLKILYDGFEVANESFRMRYSRLVVPLKKSIELERYNWMVTLVDLWGLPLEIDVIPRLTSTAMQTPTMLTPKQKSVDSYEFTNLVPAIYLLQIQYKSFRVEKEIKIPSADESLVFPVEFPITLRVFDSRGVALNGAIVQISRKEKIKETSSDSSVEKCLLPPGIYLVKVISRGTVIGQRLVKVTGERSIDLVTNQEPIYPLVVIVLACILISISMIVTLLKKEPLYGVIGLVANIVVVSLMFPWWTLQGAASDLEFSLTVFVLPVTVISRTTTSQVIAGELTVLPEIFTSVMMLIPVCTGIIIFLCVLLLMLHWRSKKQWQVFFLIGTLVLVVCSLGLFIGAMSEFTKVGVGSLIGQGTLDVMIPGADVAVPVVCQWGLGVGLWLYLFSALVVVFLIIFLWYKKIEMKRG
jgi:hypothetical protein